MRPNYRSHEALDLLDGELVLDCCVDIGQYACLECPVHSPYSSSHRCLAND